MTDTAAEILANHGSKANVSLGCTTTEIIEICALLPHITAQILPVNNFFRFNCQNSKKVKHQRLASD